MDIPGMGIMDILSTGYKYISGGDKKTDSAPKESGMMEKLTSTIGLSSKEKSEASEIKEESKEERAGILKEAGKSIMLRKTPGLSAYWDIAGNALGLKGPEAVPWQNEFDTITGLLRIVPESWKKFITDPIANSSIFKGMVQYWPLMGDDVRNRASKGEPDGVVDAIRVMHQDLAAGKTGMSSILGLIGK